MHKVFLFYILASALESLRNISMIKTDNIVTYDSKLNKFISLYAFTDNKKFARRFKKERNMKFFETKIIYLDDNEYIDFCKLHNAQELDTFDLLGKKYYNNKEHDIHIQVLSISNELDNIIYYPEDTITSIMTNDASELTIELYSKKVFNNRIIDILKYIFNIDNITDIIYSLESEIYSENDKIDEFNLFIRIYHILFK